MEEIKIVHVDDSETELKLMELMVAKIAGVKLLAQFNNTEEAAIYILKNEVDLAILNIEMPKHDGFWLANEIKDTRTLIVFFTEHTKYAFQAFESCAIHCLLKPVSITLLNKIIKRYKKYRTEWPRHSENQSKRITASNTNDVTGENYPERIFVDNIHKTTIINLCELMYLTASGPYTLFKMKGGEQYTASKLLKSYEKTLIKHPDFIRIQRGHIINKKFVRSIIRSKEFHSIEMFNGEQLPISSRIKENIYTFLLR